MQVVVGLGNPGPDYAATRHNVGFAVVRELARRWRFEWHDLWQVGRVACGQMGERIVTLIEPQLYMNRSGDAVASLDTELKVADLIVVHDELDLPPGRIRIKVGGGSAGHRGVESIVQQCGPDFVRIRVGIGKPPAGTETVAHVLSRFDVGEQATMTVGIGSAADAVESVLEHGSQEAMSRFNGRPPTVNDPTPVAEATKA